MAEMQRRVHGRNQIMTCFGEGRQCADKAEGSLL